MNLIQKFRNALHQRAHRTDLYSKKDYWNDKAEKYDGSSVSMWGNKTLNELFHREQTMRVTEYVPDISGKSLLDVGCGTGRMSRHFASLGANVIAVDFAASAVEIAKAEPSKFEIDYRCQSIFDLNENAKFDVVASWGSLTVACRDENEFRDAVRRMVCALVPGGSLMMFEPFHHSFLHRVLKLSRKQVLSILEEEGLEVKTAEHFHFWPTRLALAFIDWPAWLTHLGHKMGQFVLATILRRSRFGDYQFIGAVKPFD